MIFIVSEECVYLTAMKLKKEIVSWIGIFAGCFVLAAGFVYFINPYNIVPGGVYGASIVLHNLMPKIQVGWFGYMFDIPLLLMATYFLGAKLGAKTVVASMVTPLMMNGLSAISYPDKAALESLDPSLLLNGILDFSDQLILPVVVGAVLIGAGSGMVVRCGATTGGSDIIGMLLQKFMHIRFSNAILIVDGSVVLFGLIVIGVMMGGPIYLSLYSLIAIFIIAKCISRVINGAKDDKIIFIISEKPLEELRRFILQDLDRTATKIKSSGLYTNADKDMVFLVASYKELNQIKTKIKEADPSAFVVVTDAYDTYGEGWKQLPNPGEVQPE